MLAYGYIELKKTPWLPWYLGGSGSFENMFENAPFITTQRGAIVYALCELGYHAADLFKLLFLDEK
jgi:hypothetical protein